MQQSHVHNASMRDRRGNERRGVENNIPLPHIVFFFALWQKYCFR